MIGEKHANPHTVLGGIVKALTMAETTFREWTRSVPKKEKNTKYKEVNNRREAHKKKYNQMNRIDYLKGMGNILKDIHDMMKDGGDNNGQDKRKKPNKETATYDNVVNEPLVVENDQSRFEDPLDATVTEDEGDNDPFKDRVIGKSKRVQDRATNRPVYTKKHCAACGKGFNSKSRFKKCHLCDKLQHNLCIQTNIQDEDRFKCAKCKPDAETEPDPIGINTSSIDSAVHNSVESNAEPHLGDEDLNMPAHIVKRRNEALKRGKAMRQKRIEEEEEEEEMNNLDKSDDNLNPEAHEDKDVEDLTKYAKLCEDPKTTDHEIKDILFDLLDRKFNVELLLKSKIGVGVRQLRSRPGGIGKLASTIVVEMKRVILSDEEEREHEDSEDNEEHEQNETEDQEREEDQGEEDQESSVQEPEEVTIEPADSVNITPPGDQEREDDEEHEQEETEDIEDQDPEDQESYDQEPEDSVNITPPPEHEYEKRTALRYPCSDCGNVFPSSLLRNDHEEKEHGDIFQAEPEKSFPCDTCNFSTSYSANLKRHGELKHKKRKARTDEVVPVPENPKKIKTAFYCEECNYRCAWKHNLKRHIKLMH